MTEGRLKGYQVGEHDLVAHYSPEEDPVNISV
jgi:hypothetical protein